MFKPSSLWLWIVLLSLGGSIGTASAQSRPANRPSANAAAPLAPVFSAGTFEEIDGEIVVRVKLNDTLDTRFLLDGTNGTTLLSAEAVQSLNLKMETTGTEDAKIMQGKLASLALGKATLTDVNFTLDDDGFCTAWNKQHPEATLSGIMGRDALEKNAVGLDFATHTYGLWLGGKITLPDAEKFNHVVCTPQSDTVYSLRPGASLHIGAVTLKNPAMRHPTPQIVPLEKAAGDAMYHTQVLLNDVPVPVAVTPGSLGLSVTESIAAQIKAMPYYSPPVAAPDEKQTLPGTIYYLRRFQIGSFENVFNLIHATHRPTEDPTDTVLGVTSLTFPNCRVILDFSGHHFYLSPYDPAPGSVPAKRLITTLYDQGLFFTLDPKDRKETDTELPRLSIGKGSAAEKSGLKDGDELLEVNGKSPAAIGKLRDKGERLLAQTPLHVTIRRQGQFEKRDFEISLEYVVNIHFTGDPPPFPKDWLKPPYTIQVTYYDAGRDRAEIAKAPRLLHAELAKYPPALLERSLKDIYLFKSLIRENAAFGGFGWPDAKRLYIQDDTDPGLRAEGYLRLTVHHELAHILLADNPMLFSRSQWESLNPPPFQYRLGGGLESLRTKTGGSTELDPASWEKGFARSYGTSDLDEDFATLCEALFSGDRRFWLAVDRVEVLHKKVRMLLDFYHALDAILTEAYFRQLPPSMDWPNVFVTHYTNGDKVFFPDGGKTITPGTPPKTTEYPPGSYAIFSDKDVVMWNPPAQEP